MDGAEQLLGNAGALQHGAHEDKQRHGGQYEIGGDVFDLLGELKEHRIAKGNQSEHKGNAEQREGHREAEKNQHEQGGEHGQRSHAATPVGRLRST